MLKHMMLAAAPSRMATREIRGWTNSQARTLDSMPARRRRKQNGDGSVWVVVMIGGTLGCGAISVSLTASGNIVGGGLFWLLLLAGLTAIVGPRIRRWQQRRDAVARYEAMQRSADLNQVDYMSGVDFERWLAVLLQDFGYRVETTKVVGDYGGDLVLTQGPLRIVVQAKRYRNRIGQDAVRQVLASKALYRATVAAVVTNSHFTPHAATLARANHIYLVDRVGLHRLIEARWRRSAVPVDLLPGLRPALEGGLRPPPEPGHASVVP
jgi:restriction system protein